MTTTRVKKNWLSGKWASKSWASSLAALLLVGCTQQPGAPILGEWQGQPPGSYANTPVATDIVLEGAADATSGRYHITTTMQNPNQFSNNGTQQWGGEWTSTQRQVNGETLKFITLHDHLPSQIGGYALAADGRLHALNPNGTLNTTPDGALYTLSPVRPRGVY